MMLKIASTQNEQLVQLVASFCSGESIVQILGYLENTEDENRKKELFELVIQAITSDFFQDSSSILEPVM